jgi:lysophospholipase L1-like esterase
MRNKNNLKLSLLIYLILFIIPIAVIAKTTIHTIGDSTVANYDPTKYPQTGWGQVLNFFFNPDNIAINNKAVNGTSSKSFYNSYWTGVKSSIKTGDFVFIQFGINDKNSDPAIYTDPATTFKDYLTYYVNETKALGAYPVLITPQNSMTSVAWGTYPEAIRQLATSLNVPLIDLDVSSKALVTLVGSEYARTFIYMGLASGEYPNFPTGATDGVHLQRMGAIEIAKLVVDGLRKVSSDANINTSLISNLVPTYKVNFTTNNSTYGVVTRSEYFPTGITLTAKASPNFYKKFDNWSGDINNITPITTFVMGVTEKTINANFSLDNNYIPPSIMADFETVLPAAYDCSWGKVPTADAITIVDNPSIETVNSSPKCMKIVQKLSFMSLQSANWFGANIRLYQSFPVVITDPVHYLHFKYYTDVSSWVKVRLNGSYTLYLPKTILNKWVDVVVDLSTPTLLYNLPYIDRFELITNYDYTNNSHTADETTYLDDILVNNNPTAYAPTSTHSSMNNNIQTFEKNGILNINGITEETIASICDISGKLIQTKKLSLGLNQLNISDLAKGVYVVNLQTEDAIFVKKLLKQ